MERLARGPAVAVASGGLGVSKPAISRHLRVLEDAGLVRREVRGRTHRLSLADGTLADALAWLTRQGGHVAAQVRRHRRLPGGTQMSTATLSLEHTFEAPREAVFAAWTDPEVLRR